MLFLADNKQSNGGVLTGQYLHISLKDGMAELKGYIGRFYLL